MSESQPADLALMRELNERIVLGLLRQEGPISRAELARRSNLSRSTVSSIIAALLAADVVRETGIGDSQGGRRPIMIEFNYQSALVIGIELGNSALTVLLSDLAAHIVRRATVPFNIADGPDACVAQVVEQVNQVLGAASVARAKIVGVGVGVPGPLAYTTGRPVAPPVMPGWHDVPLRKLLEDALGLRVFVENDANLGALAEHRWGAAQGWDNVAYLYLGSAGIGCGLILDGRLYRGDIGSAGEIGHLMIEEDGPACRCGAYGCLEAIAGVPAIIKRAQAIGLPARQIDDVLRLAGQANPQAIGLLESTGEYLGIAIANLLNMINPGCVVIGGALGAAGAWLLQPIRRTLSRRGLAIAVEHVAIVSGVLGYEVVAIGAVSIVVHHAFSIPASTRTSSGVSHEAIHFS
jgi:predicted NBD/HSP70 family sugar kinase